MKKAISCRGRFRARVRLAVAALVCLPLIAACDSSAIAEGDTAGGAQPATEREAVPAPAAATLQADPATDATVPMQALVIELMTRAQAEDKDFGATFAVPSVWMFDADGQLRKRIEDVQDLDLLDSFASGDRSVAVAGNPLGLDSVIEAIHAQSGQQLHIPEDQWTMLTLVANRGCEETCPRFLEHTARFAEAFGDEFHSVTVTLEH